MSIFDSRLRDITCKPVCMRVKMRKKFGLKGTTAANPSVSQGMLQSARVVCLDRIYMESCDKNALQIRRAINNIIKFE